MSTQLLPASRYLVHSGLVVAADMSVSDQVLIEDGLIVAVGGAAHEAARHGGSVRRVDLGGSIVTAAFVDAHVHLTATGLMMSGLDLSAVRSSRQLLVKLSEYSSSRSGAIIIGHGWDDSRFDEQGLPTPAELDRASGGRPVYLTRIDVHSALVSQSLLDLLPGIAGDQGYRDSDPVAQAAHGRARTYVMSHLSGEQRKAAQTAALRHAAAEGVASVHENGGPVVSSASDLQSALALGQDAGMPEVIGYWGELFGTDTAVSLGAHGVAGDLFVDGSLGSHTAFLCDDYTDSSGRGACYIGEDDLVEHFTQSARQDLQAGVHAIGDAAIAMVLRAMSRAPQAPSSRWRIEHMEMPTAQDIQLAARLGVIASVQPLFDRLWGGQDGMYSRRLGAARSVAMNPFADLHSAGVHLAFGSDSPVTPINAWASVAAALTTHHPAHALSVVDAFIAATSGAASAAPQSHVGTVNDSGAATLARPALRRVRARLAVGEPADIAVWGPVPGLGSTPDAGVILRALSELHGSNSRPTTAAPALATLRAGGLIFDNGLFQ